MIFNGYRQKSYKDVLYLVLSGKVIQKMNDTECFKTFEIILMKILPMLNKVTRRS